MAPLRRAQALPLGLLLLSLVALITIWPGMVSQLFSPGPYAPHGICILWDRQLLSARVTMDGLIGGSYMAISIALVVLVLRLRDSLPFHWTFLAFGGFIFFCGLTHFFDILTLWYPLYWMDAALRALTAVSSVATALLLPMQLPRVRRLVGQARAADLHRRERDRLYEEQRQAVEQLQGALASRDQDMLRLLEQLRDSEALFRQALQGSPITVFLAGPDLRYRWVYNPPAALAEPIVGRADEELFSADTAAQFRLLKRRALEENAEQRQDLIVATESGDLTFDVRVLPVSTAASAQSSLIGTATDITERKTLEERLAQAQKMESIGRLAGGIAHDFNNLLTVILGNAELIREGLPAGHPIRADIDTILSTAERASRLTRQLLTFARRQSLAPQVIDLNAIVDGMRPMLDRLVGPDIELGLALGHDLPPVHADPMQIEQVLLNLVVNARDAIVGRGTIRVATAERRLGPGHRSGLPPGPYLRLTVSDTGQGFDPALLPRLFEPFFSTKGPQHGTGLGLAICYGIVTQHGGAIELSGQPEGGSTAEVLLPATSLSQAEQPASDAQPRGRGELVLLAEDQPAVRELAQRLLRGWGYQVISAESGAEALRLLGEAGLAPDMLLSDIVMPEMDGVELARRLREVTPGLPVLLMSGYSEQSAQPQLEELLAQPGVRRIHKPFSAALLAQQLRALLDG